MIDTNFDDFLNIENLKRDEKRKYIVKDMKYNIAFYHDYKPSLPIDGQHDAVKEKYSRRIKRFYNYISEKTLFIRYIESKKEYEYLCENYDHIISILRRYNENNDLMLISKDIKGNKIPMHTIYVDKVPYKTSQRFANTNKELYSTLLALPFPEEKKSRNLQRYRRSLPKRVLNSVKKLFRKILY